MKLVIIAAGQGSRLRSAAGQINKTILEIGDRSLMEYLLANARICAVEGCVVVTGYHSQAIEEFLDGLDTDLQIETVHNPHWRQPNGISVLAARPFIGAGEDFLVTMSDHLYEPALLRAVLNSQLEDTIANVALDFNIDAIFDIDDGMKVAVDGDNRQTITAMSKTLQRYDAIDCGVFKCGYEFFNYLDQAAAAGRGS
ncbi:MAG: NTP transferase domain-containing protein, partial [Candidatus Marinimicrobia bacterium]|nr:NTP transferase domain-containing protein [Candidatus Neomarinimicrobiota bacterium]